MESVKADCKAFKFPKTAIYDGIIYSYRIAHIDSTAKKN